jgi:hypothetical protein
VDESEWVEIVAPRGPAEAREAFVGWLQDRGLDEAALQADDLRQDIIRAASGKTQVRYRIRKSVIALSSK